MKKILENIKNANQILLFLAAILFIGMISKDLFRDLLREKYEPTKVEIVDSSKSTENKISPSYKVEFDRKIKDVYVFQIKSDAIDNSIKHNVLKTKVIEGYSEINSSYSSYLRDNVVNLMFVTNDKKQRILLEKDALLTNFTAAIFEDSTTSEKLDKNIYLITTNDSNNDGYLDQKDQHDLYVSSYNGSELTLVLSNVEYYSLIEDNLLLIQQSGSNGKFYS